MFIHLAVCVGEPAVVGLNLLFFGFLRLCVFGLLCPGYRRIDKGNPVHVKAQVQAADNGISFGLFQAADSGGIHNHIIGGESNGGTGEGCFGRIQIKGDLIEGVVCAGIPSFPIFPVAVQLGKNLVDGNSHAAVCGDTGGITAFIVGFKG